VYRVKRAWTESQVTWNVYTTGNSWQTAGCSGADDRESTAIGTRNTGASDPLNEYKTWALTPTTKPGLDLGYGWHMRVGDDTYSSGDNGYRYASSDHATTSIRPKLVVDYTAGGAAFMPPPPKIIKQAVTRSSYW
jgi:hypothetical protein